MCSEPLYDFATESEYVRVSLVFRNNFICGGIQKVLEAPFDVLPGVDAHWAKSLVSRCDDNVWVCLDLS